MSLTCLCGHLAQEHWSDETTGIVYGCPHLACGCIRLRFEQKEPISDSTQKVYEEVKLKLDDANPFVQAAKIVR